MKKIILLPIVALFFSCSADDATGNLQNENASLVYEHSHDFITMADTPSCFTSVTASVSASGFNNPTLIFTPAITGNIAPTAKFKIRVEVQALSDCDNMNSETGSLLTFVGTGTYQNVASSPPSISIHPSLLPSCYKWKFVMEGISDAKKNPICYSSSQWYESPIF